MRKTQEKLIARAIKNNWTPEKIEFLKNSTEPIRFLENIFYFIQMHSEEELGDYSIVFDLREYGDNVLWQCRNIPMDVITRIISSDICNEDKKEILYWVSCECPLHLIKRMYCIWVKYNRPYICFYEIFYDMCEAYKSEKIHDDELFFQYLNYLLSHMLDCKKIAYNLAKAYKYRFAFEDMTVVADCDLNKYSELIFKNRFGYLQDIYEFDDKSSCKKTIYLDQGKVNAAIDACEMFPQITPMRVDTSSLTLNISFDFNKLVISISKYGILNFSRCFVKGKDKEEWKIGIYKEKYQNSKKYLIYADGGFYTIIKRNNLEKCIPMSIKDLYFIYDMYGKECFNLFKTILLHHCSGYVMKDIIQYIENRVAYEYPFASGLPPISVNECCNTYNLDTLMKQKYPRFTDINWNKTDLCVGYMIFKTMSWVDEKSKGILLNQKNFKPDLEYYMDNMSINIDTKQYFLINIIMKKLTPDTYWYDEEHNKVDENNVKNVVKDYVSMCRQCKRKISLSFKSAKKLKEAHDDLVVIVANKHTPVIKIPKDTKFKTLRKILPEEFECITSRRRIILEGKNMHHCVASYAGHVNKDKCAIYSWVNPDTKKRYTIEFGCSKKGQYYIAQIQGMCDRGCPEEVREYVSNFIKTN